MRRNMKKSRNSDKLFPLYKHIQRMRCQLRTERISGFGGAALNKHFS